MSQVQVSLEENFNYNKRVNIINGILATTATNLVSPYYSKFAERLGASAHEIAYLTSLPYLVSILAYIPGALLIESLKNKQKVIGSTMFLHKIFFLLIAIIPFFNVNKASIFVLMIGFMNLPGSIGNMGFQSNIADVFTLSERADAMGLRNKYAALIGIAITFISGLLLSYLPKSNDEAIGLYQIFFTLAFFISLVEVRYFFKFKVTLQDNVSNINLKESLKTVIKHIPSNKKFLLFTFASSFFHVGWVGAQPLFNIYTINVLGANENWLSAISIASSVSSIWAYSQWPKWSSKKGNNVALSVAIIGMGITPLLYAISNKLWLLFLFNILIGVSVAGTVLLLFNILLEIIPSENRTIYIAIYNTIIAIISSISPILFVNFMDATNIYIALVVVGIIRTVSSLFFYRLK